MSIPFGPLFAEALQRTAEILTARLPVRTRYAFTHGDEISLLLDHSESFGLRRRAKIISYVCSIASLTLSEELSAHCIFDAKLAELPTEQHVVDYFLWQRKVAFRNYCSRITGFRLESQGADTDAIAEARRALGEGSLEAIANIGVDTDQIPAFHLRGSACWWPDDQEAKTEQVSLITERDLPQSDSAYENLVRTCVAGTANGCFQTEELKLIAASSLAGERRPLESENVSGSGALPTKANRKQSSNATRAGGPLRLITKRT